MTACPCGTLAWRLWDETRAAFERRLAAYQWHPEGDHWRCPYCDRTHDAPLSHSLTTSNPSTTKPTTSPATQPAGCSAGTATTTKETRP